MTVAQKLQKLLVAYRLPHGVKHYRIQRVKHVFLDEPETDDFEELEVNIKNALKKSSFLIVICSEKTKKSDKCLREIDYFKELHSGKTDKILTLLVEGDPNEVFPDSLCWEEQEITLNDGSKITRSVEIEPLAANITADSQTGRMKKLKSEFLRLIAPIFGCGYDVLSRKHKKRFMIRLVFAVILSMCFIIGLTTGAKEFIKQKRIAANERAENYIKTAQTLIDRGDKVLATAVVTDLMDKTSKLSENLKSEFERILMQSIYVTKYSQYTTLSHDSNVSDFVFSQDKTSIYTATDSGVVTLWDAKNGSKKAEIEIRDKSILKILHNDDNLYVLSADGTLYIIDSTTLNMKKHLSLGTDKLRMEISDMVFYNGNIYYDTFHNSSAADPSYEFYKIDLQNSIVEDIMPYSSSYTMRRCVLDDDRGKIVFYQEVQGLTILDLNTNNSEKIRLSDDDKVIDVTYNKDTGHIVVVYSKEQTSDIIAISCYDLGGALIKTTGDIDFSGLSYKRITDISKDERFVLFQDSNNAFVVDFEHPQVMLTYGQSSHELLNSSFIDDNTIIMFFGGSYSETILWKPYENKSYNLQDSNNYPEVLISDDILATGGNDESIRLMSMTDAMIENIVSEKDTMGETNPFNEESKNIEDGTKAISPNGNYKIIGATENDAHILKLVDCQTDGVLCNVKTPVEKFAAVAVRDIDLAALITQNGMYCEFNPQTGQAIRSGYLELKNTYSSDTMQMVVDFDNERVSVISKTSNSSCDGALYSTQTFEKLLDYPHANRIEANLTCDKIYRRIAQNDDEWIEISIPDYDRLCELSREQLSGRILTDEEKQRLNLN